MINLNPKQKRAILRTARDNPTIILNGIGETKKCCEESALRNLAASPKDFPEKIWHLCDLEETFRLWVRDKYSTLNDQRVIQLFIAAKFPNPAPVWNHKTQKYDVPWKTWMDKINQFFGK